MIVLLSCPYAMRQANNNAEMPLCHYSRLCCAAALVLVGCCAFLGGLMLREADRSLTPFEIALSGVAHPAANISAPWGITGGAPSSCVVEVTDRPNGMELYWENTNPMTTSLSNTTVTLADLSITNAVNVRYYNHKARCLPLTPKPGTWSLPKKVWISQPCFAKNQQRIGVGHHNDGLIACACDAHVVSFKDVYWATEDAGNRYDIMSLAVAELRNPLSNVTEWFAIDRSNINLGKMRCINDFRTGAVRLRRIIDNLTESICHRGGANATNIPAGQLFDEVYFALGTILLPQGHRFESLLTAAANYYASGLHLRRVPWALPRLLSKASQGIVESYLELTTLLDIPVVYYNESAVQFAKRVHFFEDEHGDNFMCFKPFLKNYLWPRVLEIAKEKKFAVYENISFVKAKSKPSPGVFSPGRGLYLHQRFLNFANHTLHMPIFNVLPLAEKMFYVNTASNILTSWGGAGTFVFLLMMPRPVNVVLIVHRNYAREAMGTRINFKQKRGLSPVFRKSIARSIGLLYDFEHEDFKARFVFTRNILVFVVDNLFSEIMRRDFVFPKTEWS